MKSTLLNMTAVLLGITFVASAGVGLVNMVTVEPIANAEKAAKEKALSNVLPAFDSTSDEVLDLDQMPIKVYTATKDGAVTGYAVETMSKKGFGGNVRLMVGFTAAGLLNNINVLEQKETPGLGSNMSKDGNKLQESFLGDDAEKDFSKRKLNNGQLAVVKDAGDVDALTAATISSRAYVDAVNRAWAAYKQVAASTASQQQTEESAEEPVAQEGAENE